VLSRILPPTMDEWHAAVPPVIARIGPDTKDEPDSEANASFVETILETCRLLIFDA